MRQNPEPVREPPPIEIVLSAVGGYGSCYLNAWRETCDSHLVRLAGVVDPFPAAASVRSLLKKNRVPVYSNMEEFYHDGRRADLAVIASPIADHHSQAMCALAHGSHVLCEKPLAAAVQDVDALIRARDAAGKHLLVGYQWSYSRGVQALKADLAAGRWGRPLRAKSLCLWPRDRAYYRRNRWAGRLRDSKGRWVLDSPAQNAMSHFLHNMFYLLGARVEVSARPVRLEAELYRVYPIENADSVACRVFTGSKVECLFFASHAVCEEEGPMFALECEGARINFEPGPDGIVAVDRRGRETRYGSPDDDDPFKKFREAIKTAQGEGTVVCGPEAARSQVLCVNGLQETVRSLESGRRVAGRSGRSVDFDLTAGVTTLKGVHVKEDPAAGRLWSPELAEAFRSGYDSGRLPFELGAAWARQGLDVDLEDYSRFPSGSAAAGREAE